MQLSATVRRIATVAVIVAVVLSPIVGSVSAALPAASGDGEGASSAALRDGGGLADINASSDEVVSGSGNVSIWHRSPLVLNSDEEEYADNTAVKPTLSLPTVRVTYGESSLEYRKKKTGFYEAGKQVRAELNPNYVGKAGILSGQKVQYVLVRLEDNDVPNVDSLTDLTALLDDPDVRGRIVDRQTGDGSVEFTPQQSGQHLLMAVAVDDDGGVGVTEPSDGQLSVDSPVTIVGFDLLPVREGDDTVSVHASGAPTGRDVTVTANTTSAFAGETVRHTVLLVNESKLGKQSTDVTVENGSVSTISTSVNRTNGVTRIEPDISNETLPVTAFGVNTTEDLAAVLTNESDIENVTITRGDTVLNASVTSVEGGAEKTIEVGTRAEWPSGEYTYLYVGESTEDGRTVVRKGTVALEEDSEAYVKHYTVSPTSVGPGDEVTVSATVYNPGDEEQETVELNVDGSKVDERTITLASEETKTITFSTSFDAEGLYQVSIDDLAPTTVEVDAEAYVTDFSLSEKKLGKGETLRVDATIENPGGKDGEETVELKVDGQGVVDTEVVDISGVETKTVTLTTSFPDEGFYQVSVDDLASKEVEVTDEAYVTDFSLSKTTVKTGEKLEVAANIMNPGGKDGQETVELKIDGERKDSKTVTIAGEASKTVKFTLSFSKTGKKAVSIDHLPAKTVTVKARSTNGGAPSGGAPSGGGGQPGDEDKGPDTDVIETGSGSTITVGEGSIGQTFGVDLGTSAVSNGIGLTGLDINLGQSTSGFRIEVTRAQSSPPDGVPAVDRNRDSARAIRYFTATPLGQDAPVFDGVKYTFTLPDSELPDGATSERVVLLRYNETESKWNQLPTTALGGGTYTARSPGFSAYAIGVREKQQSESQFIIDETSIGSTELDVGEETTVEAIVRNDGNASGTFTAELSINGEAVDSKTVTLAAGESATVSFTVSFDEAGDYQVAINGQDVATASVTAQTETPDGETDTPKPSGISPWMLLVALMVIILAIGGFVLYRSQDEL